MSINQRKVVIFSFFEQFRSSGLKSKVEPMTRKETYALIWSGDWLPWLESKHLRNQFSELFSVLFIRMKSYDPITALHYA